MDTSHKFKCLILYIICFILELVGVVLTCLHLDSSCVLAREVNIWVMFYLFLVPTAIVPDLIIFLMMLKYPSVGLSCLSVLYNLIMGPVCILGGIFMLFLLINFCGSSTQIFFLISACLAILAGIIHILIGIFCEKRIPDDDLDWLRK